MVFHTDERVVINPPPEVIAERQRLGLDKRDEVWEGEYHMAPAPFERHEHIVFKLALALYPLVDAAGLRAGTTVGVSDPSTTDHSNYRIPDLTVYGDEARSERGVEGAARLVVEVRSPGDDSLKKLPFYAAMGVGEVLIVDRDTKAVRRFVGGAEVAPDADGWHRLTTLPARLRTEGTTLLVETAAGTTSI